VRAAIAERNAMTVHSDGDFSNDVARLANRIAEITDVAAEDFGQLVRNCRRMGLVMAKPTFQDDNFGRTAIEEAEELIVVQNDGRSWIDTNRERLMERAQRRGRHTTIVLLHPRSTFLEVLIRKSSKSMAQQLGELHRSFEILQPYIASGAIVLKGHFLFNPHTLIMTERFAVIDQYFLCESGDLPRFKYAVAERGLYRRIRSDFEELIRRHSADISAADFR